MGVLFTDSFSGAENSLIKDRAGWSAFAAFASETDHVQINATNQVKRVGGGNPVALRYDTTKTNHFSEIELSGLYGAANSNVVCARLADRNNYIGVYQWGAAGNDLDIVQVVGGVSTRIEYVSGLSFSAGASIKVEIFNDVLNVYVDDVAIGTGNWDVSGILAGETGVGFIIGGANDPVFDNFAAGDDVVLSSGSLSETLDNTTSSASGTVTGSGVSGSLSASLENTTSSASGLLKASGAISELLDNTAIISAGSITISGAISEVLEGVSSAANADVIDSGSISGLLDDVTISASGALTIPGSISEVLENITATVIGTVGDVAAGSISEVLDDIIISASGTVPYTGAINETLDDIVTTATGSVVLNATGTVSETLEDIALTASGVITVNAFGTISETLEDVSISAAGNVAIDYITPAHNMSVTLENRVMISALENREMTIR